MHAPNTARRRLIVREFAIQRVLAAALAALALTGAALAAMVSTAQSQPAAPSSLPTQAERERAFADLLADARMSGTWQMSDGQGGRLSEPRGDAYHILAAHKAESDWWQLQCRIQYGEHDVVLPVRVRVVWAEDTPVITVQDLTLPGMGTYSARVLFHGRYYSGVWSAGDHGGVMSGVVSKRADESDERSGSEPAP